MAVQQELWKPDIIEFLVKDNEFMTQCKIVDEFVLEGKVVHIPQAGAASGFQRNRVTLPGTVIQRTDTDVTYVIDEYTTDPALIPNKDTAELSYDKRASVLRQDMAVLKEAAANNLLYSWVVNLTAAERIATTGALVTATGAGATGTRKMLTEADIRAAQTKLNRDNVAKEGRVMLITADQQNELMSDNNLKYAFQQVVNLPNGVVARLYGFDIMVRATTVQLDTGATVKLPEAAGAATDNVAAVFYQRDMVERAFGDIKMFEDTSNPLYYGDLYSFLVRLGGRACRTDRKGVGLLLQVP